MQQPTPAVPHSRPHTQHTHTGTKTQLHDSTRETTTKKRWWWRTFRVGSSVKVHRGMGRLFFVRLVGWRRKTASPPTSTHTAPPPPHPPPLLLMLPPSPPRPRLHCPPPLSLPSFSSSCCLPPSPALNKQASQTVKHIFLSNDKKYQTRENSKRARSFTRALLR